MNKRLNHSPPLEGCLQGGVVPEETNIPLEGCLQGGVTDNATYKKRLRGPGTKRQLQIIINGINIKLNPILNLPYEPKLKSRAKLLRYAKNLPEVLFWIEVTKGRFHEIDFDRQRVIGNYIVDFYVKKLGLVIEIDGSSHDHKVIYDQRRELYLTSLGLKVYRICVEDIMKHIDFAMMGLENYITEKYGIGLPTATIPVYDHPPVADNNLSLNDE